MLGCKWTLVRKVFSDLLLVSIGCFVQSPPFALPHFTNFEAFLLHKVSSQCKEPSFLATTLKIHFKERETQLLTGTQVVKATHGFEHSVAMRAKPINTEAVNFLLSACCKEAFNFTFWSCSLEIGHDHNFKVAGLVLSRCEATRYWIEIPTRIKTGRWGLTNRLRMYLAGINPNSRVQYACRFSIKSFINNCFACKIDRWTTSNILLIFSQKVFIYFHEWIEFCISSFV